MSPVSFAVVNRDSFAGLEAISVGVAAALRAGQVAQRLGITRRAVEDDETRIVALRCAKPGRDHQVACSERVRAWDLSTT